MKLIDGCKKKCKKCGRVKHIDGFQTQNKYYSSRCKLCLNRLKRVKYKTDPIPFKTAGKKYRETHKTNSAYNRQYYITNKQKIRDYQNAYYANKIKSISYRLRRNVSRLVAHMLSSQNTGKNNFSVLQFLPYSIQELKDHLERCFEPWMNWSNYGSYKHDIWNDDDITTWTWQLDHVVPQSDLPYTSMGDDNFKKCWALENLRPYSSKQNLLDGSTRARHV